jgi:hypothetical protein
MTTSDKPIVHWTHSIGSPDNTSGVIVVRLGYSGRYVIVTATSGAEGVAKPDAMPLVEEWDALVKEINRSRHRWTLTFTTADAFYVTVFVIGILIGLLGILIRHT